MYTSEVRLDQEWIEEAKKCHKLIQGIICILANHRSEVDVTDPEFHPKCIFKCEGGVTVKGIEMVLKSIPEIFVYDDWARGDRDKNKKYEKITAEACETIYKELKDFSTEDKIKEQVYKILSETGLEKEKIYVMLFNFTSNPYGDNLLSFFREM